MIATTRESTNSGDGTPLFPLWRLMANVWLRHQDRQVEHALLRLDHAGVWEDFCRVSRG